MVVLITGMMRSGSTFTFNVAKQLLTRNGSIVYWGPPAVQIEDVLVSKGNDYDHLIFKQHLGSDFSRLLIKHQCARAICSYRDPMEAMASRMQVFEVPFERSLQEFKRSIEFITYQRDYALMVSYEDIERKPMKVIRKIARHLNLSVDLGELKAIASTLGKEEIKRRYDDLSKDEADIREIGNSYYDTNTFFHRRHVRGPDAIASAEFFTEAERKIIREELKLPVK